MFREERRGFRQTVRAVKVNMCGRPRENVEWKWEGDWKTGVGWDLGNYCFPHSLSHPISQHRNFFGALPLVDHQTDLELHDFPNPFINFSSHVKRSGLLEEVDKSDAMEEVKCSTERMFILRCFGDENRNREVGLFGPQWQNCLFKAGINLTSLPLFPIKMPTGTTRNKQIRNL